MPKNLFVQPGSGLSFPWREYVGPSGSTINESWQNESAQASMTIEIYPDDRYTAQKEILGWSKRNETKPFNLQRQVPWRHPYWFSMYANGISNVTGISWQDKESVGGGPFSTYQYLRMTVTFGTLPFDVLTDLQMVQFDFDEPKRYVFKHPRITVEFAQYGDATDYKFAYVAGVPSMPPAIAGTPIPGPGRALGVSYEHLVWKWFYVPDNYIFDSSGRATNIQLRYGKVNSAPFEGYPVGTLLFEGVDYEPWMNPVDSADMNLPIWSPPRAWNVVFHFKYFEPTTSNALDNSSFLNNGHNLAPDVKTAGTNPILWWPVILTGGTARYDGANFYPMFDPVGI